MDRKIIEERAEEATPERPILGEALAELRKLCAKEQYTLDVPSRSDRPNPFADEEGPGASE